MAANQTNRETIRSSHHLLTANKKTNYEIPYAKTGSRTQIKKRQPKQKQTNKQTDQVAVGSIASDLQGEKGCDITEMPQMQITH
jgi:hypothetical protein